MDATDESAILALGEPGSFDAVVCNMAIMDMESIEPMVAASARLLTPAGRFVFSTLHPAFNSGNVRPMITAIYSVKVSSYSRSSVGRGVAIPNQPVEQWYFHRPLWMILEPFFDHGFALDGLEEPLVGPEQGRRGRPASSTPSCRAFSSLGCGVPSDASATSPRCSSSEGCRHGTRRMTEVRRSACP